MYKSSWWCPRQRLELARLTIVRTLPYSLATLQEERAEEDETELGTGAGQRRLFEAKAMLEGFMTGRTNVLGRDHLDTVTAQARLAPANRKLARLDDCENAPEKVLKVVTFAYRRFCGRFGVRSVDMSDESSEMLHGPCCGSKSLPDTEKADPKSNSSSLAHKLRLFWKAMKRCSGKSHHRTAAALLQYVELLDLVAG